MKDQLSLNNLTGVNARVSKPAPVPWSKGPPSSSPSRDPEGPSKWMQVRNLAPRKGIISDITRTLKGVQVDAGAVRVLPRAIVNVSVGGITHSILAPSSNLNPKFPSSQKVHFPDVRMGSTLSVQVYDRLHKVKGPLQKRLAGSAEILTSHIRSSLSPVGGGQIPGSKEGQEDTIEQWDPVYMWVPLQRSSSEQKAMGYEKGKSGADNNLAAVVESLQLDNQMLDTMRPVVISPSDRMDQGAGQKGLPTANANQSTLRRILATTDPRPLIYFDLVRTLASGGRSGADKKVEAENDSSKELAGPAPTGRNSSSGMNSSSGQSGSPLKKGELDHSASIVSTTSGGLESTNAIISFKRLVFHIGALDFSTDQTFMEELLFYLTSLPTNNLDPASRSMDDMEAMLAHGIPPAAATQAATAAVRRTVTKANPLADPKPEEALNWLVAKAEQELTAMRDQSSSCFFLGNAEQELTAMIDQNSSWFFLGKAEQELAAMRDQSSSWFFLEEFYLSSIQLNITMNLASNFNMSGGRSGGAGGVGDKATDTDGREVVPMPRPEEEDEKGGGGLLGGALNRVSGGSGFQLINVTNAPISLASISLPNKLFNKVGFINTLTRHYMWIAMTEARKVLGGAGPAIAVVPATVLWFSISVAEMGKDVAGGRLSALKIPSRLGFYGFTSMGQVTGMFSRLLISILVILPVQRLGRLSDAEASDRFVKRPQTGARLFSGSLLPLGIMLGLTKGLLGLIVRPVSGIVDSSAKVLQGMGLFCLGKRGIQGKIVRRIYVPSEPLTASSDVDNQQAKLKRAQLIDAWQTSLAFIHEDLAGDVVVDVIASSRTRVVLQTNRHVAYLVLNTTHLSHFHVVDVIAARRTRVVVDVIAARRTRVVLLTNRHVAYLIAKHHSSGANKATGQAEGVSVTYKVKWVLGNSLIDNIRSVERSYRISVEYRKAASGGATSHENNDLGDLAISAPRPKMS
eukprot:gene5982-5274_t